VLDDARVAGASGRGRQRRPAEDLAAFDDDDAVVHEPAAIELLPGRSLRLEGRIARRDPLGVDPLDRGPVRLGHVSNLEHSGGD
jgi:hypothetical protein